MLAFCVSLLMAGALASVDALQCSDGYPADHTLCATDRGPAKAMTKDLEDSIVQKHNDFRTLEAASDMLKMEWNNELAAVATKWATQCLKGHDNKTQRLILAGDLENVYIGQNAARGYDNFVDAITGWWKEIADFTYGEKPPTNKMTGHYTQVVWAESYLVGCGWADCTGLFPDVSPTATYYSYVCNYAPGGNFNFEKRGWKPYLKESGPCGECNAVCDNNLCDCSGVPEGESCMKVPELEPCEAGYADSEHCVDGGYYFNHCSANLGWNEELCCKQLTPAIHECKIKCKVCKAV